MSLLIKALEKAEQAQSDQTKLEQTKAEQGKIELSLADKQQAEAPASKSPTKQRRAPANLAAGQSAGTMSNAPAGSQKPKFKPLPSNTELVLSLDDSVKTVFDQPENNTTQNSAAESNANQSSPKRAANVFSAKRPEDVQRKSNFGLIAGAGLLALLGVGFYYYQQINKMSAPVIAQPAHATPISSQANETPKQQTAAIETPQDLTAVAPPVIASENVEKTLPETIDKPATEQLAANTQLDKTPIAAFKTKKISKAKTQPVFETANENAGENTASENDLETDETMVAEVPIKKSSRNKRENNNLEINVDEKAIAMESASIKVSKTKAKQTSINPTIMAAYDAYNAGNDNDAQKLYKQALQHDVRNVDALLGLGAIAERQSRVADANGWYRKVLEVEPRNSNAQTGLMRNQPQTDATGTESHLKNMLAKQPEDANIQAALGNYYAEANDWPAAQQAYFEAFRLRANADNAFNLAVSLDQMGKPKLALPYYQQALAIAQKTNANLDTGAIEARIAAIQ
jgi:tetratricopeptide (TPR) repeat protein